MTDFAQGIPRQPQEHPDELSPQEVLHLALTTWTRSPCLTCSRLSLVTYQQPSISCPASSPRLMCIIRFKGVVANIRAASSAATRSVLISFSAIFCHLSG